MGCYYFIKKQILINFVKMIKLLKKNIFINLALVFENYIILFYLLFFFNFSNKLKVLFDKNFNFLCLFNKLNKYDRILFF